MTINHAEGAREYSVLIRWRRTLDIDRSVIENIDLRYLVGPIKLRGYQLHRYTPWGATLRLFNSALHFSLDILVERTSGILRRSTTAATAAVLALSLTGPGFLTSFESHFCYLESLTDLEWKGTTVPYYIIYNITLAECQEFPYRIIFSEFQSLVT